eukprot:g37079.t1
MVIVGVIVTLEEPQDGHVIQGVGGRVKMGGNQKMLSFVANRAQMLYGTVSESMFGHINTEEVTAGATDIVDQVDGCAGESLFNVEGLFCALNGGDGG